MSTVIDIHTHAFNDQLAQLVVPELEARGRVKAVCDGTITGLLSSMDANGIAKSVIQPIATKPKQVEAINWWSKKVMESYPGRLTCFGALHPDMTWDEMSSVIAGLKKDGFKGVKLHPEYQMFFPDEDKMEMVYRLLADNDLILLIHAGKDLCFSGEVKATPGRLADVLSAFPTLKMVAAHLGGFQQWDEAACCLTGRRLWLDTAFCAGQCDLLQAAGLIKEHGVQHILMGSDSPWGDQQNHLNFIEQPPLDREEKRRILGLNALELLA